MPTLPDYSLRRYQPSDWKQLCRIHDSARLDELRLAGCVGAFLSLEATAKSEGLFDGELIVAQDADTIKGFVSFTLDQLGWIYTDPTFYRQGVARSLVRHVIKSTGPVLELEVLQGNTPAITLYQSEGFTITERRKGTLEGNDAFKVTGLIMQRRR